MSVRLRRARRIVPVVAVAVLLVLAGCSGGGGGGTTTADGGAGTAGGATTTQASTMAEGLPPGIYENGTVDGERLLSAHDSALSDQSFTHVIEANRTIRASGGTRNSSDRQVTQSDGETFLTTYTREGARSFQQVTWGNDSVAVSRVQIGDRTQYDSRNAERLSQNLTGEQFVRQFLSMGQYSVESVDRQQGRVTLRATSPNPTTEMGENASVSSYDGTLVVDFRGRVRRMDIEVVIERNSGATVTLDASYQLSAIGDVSVDRPDWVSQALSEVRQRPAIR